MKRHVSVYLLGLLLGCAGVTFSACGDDDEEVVQNPSTSTGTGSTTTTVVGTVVDLGLSVKWASHNVGASKDVDYGGRYGWADPTGLKTSTSVNDYPSANPPTNISGTSYDIARAKWGENWRMPTDAEVKELIDNCVWTWMTKNDVWGCMVRGRNGNAIFLPAAGIRRSATQVDFVGYGATYWSGTLAADGVGVNGFYFNVNGVNRDVYPLRYQGYSVRPVTE